MAKKSKKLLKNIGFNLLWLIGYSIFFAFVESWLQGMATDTSNPMFRTAGVLFDAVNKNYPIFLGFPVILGWIIISVKVWFPKVVLAEQIKPELSTADELEKYAELRDKGIITDIEFQAKKKKLLDL
tara:strand:- start:195 stop:575 length:381 start_codon:yes stop_codon:yes gene_type:complete